MSQEPVMTEQEYETILNRAGDELTAMEISDSPPFLLPLSPVERALLISAIQMTLRTSERTWNGHSDTLEAIARRLQATLSGAPSVQQMIETGWNPPPNNVEPVYKQEPAAKT